ncbi:hypothetical protein [Nonomuraea sp. B19D2]|uniref:hypothetical protein n=1 Tax=Nonomuraea sp. B19D2 TaxID=3159561 RepID=UPI0032DBEF48
MDFEVTSPPLLIASLVVALFSVSALVIQGRAERRRLAAAGEDPADGLRQRADQATVALGEAVALMNELQREVGTRKAQLLEAVAEADKVAKFLDVNEEARDFLRGVTTQNTKSAIRAQQREQWKFVLIGAGISIPIGIIINLLF